MKARWAYGGLALMLFCLGLLLVREVYEGFEITWCMIRQRNYWDALMGDDGKLRTAEELQADPVFKYPCAGNGKHLIYRAPKATDQAFSDLNHPRAIIWCPEPCHWRGMTRGRVITFDRGGCDWFPEEEVRRIIHGVGTKPRKEIVLKNYPRVYRLLKTKYNDDLFWNAFFWVDYHFGKGGGAYKTGERLYLDRKHDATYSEEDVERLRAFIAEVPDEVLEAELIGSILPNSGVTQQGTTELIRDAMRIRNVEARYEVLRSAAMMSYTLKKRKWRGTLSALAEALNEPEKEHPDQQLAALVYAYAFGIDVDKDRVRTVYLASRSDPRETARAILSDEIGRKLKTDDEFLQALASSN